MKLNNLFTDEDAVSPVIGVILMVAITVILAAVIGAFVLGIGSGQEAAPQATLSFNYDQGGDGSWDDGDGFSIKHTGGEAITVSQISVKYDGTDLSTSGDTYGETKPNGDTWTAGESWDATDANTGAGGTAAYASGKKTTVVWTAESGDSTQILADNTLP